MRELLGPSRGVPVCIMTTTATVRAVHLAAGSISGELFDLLAETRELAERRVTPGDAIIWESLIMAIQSAATGAAAATGVAASLDEGTP